MQFAHTLVHTEPELPFDVINALSLSLSPALVLSSGGISGCEHGCEHGWYPITKHLNNTLEKKKDLTPP
jgi:hypothetical protein